jgi:molybdopterin converting factor small subunit
MAKQVTLRYWAAARAIAGVETEQVAWDELLCSGECTVADILAVVGGRRPELDPILAVASILVDGIAVTRGHPVVAGDTLEVLPPFAGG